MERFITHPAALSGRPRTRRAAVLASALAVACFGAAGAAKADASPPAAPDNASAVVVLIGANDYGFDSGGRVEPTLGSHTSPKRAYVRGP